ncbi:MAG: ubiquinol-cytochrome c reductase iron-sulfur subunit [Alphaproteobacteria bacterium]|nr:ubiquinol-cytochrome c reductase iron-sulfur subunit [Alphaproteobacteria bacterium]MDX5370763.1 ubiquinol-cytochrome c reductase iron-sulfur subunit [Alphaproteobacteria bacterium]MDX5465177.1 ubiquinol-cytochrome c reductase iron-sulfur subunit [Alphaproteobacteria bacterium]
MTDTTAHQSHDPSSEGDGGTRRDFIYVATAAFGAVGAAGAVWPLINQMNPDKSVLALASTEVDLSPIEEGQRVTVTWRGKPVFIDHRTAGRIEEARSVDVADLPDPQTDAERVKEGHEAWLVMVGICTHLGCVPNGQGSGESRGEYGGWFCPCHGSHYDTSGRIRRGPAPRNLDVPPYEFLDDTTIRIG